MIYNKSCTVLIWSLRCFSSSFLLSMLKSLIKINLYTYPIRRKNVLIANSIVRRPQTLLSFGNVSFAKYHVIGKRMSENIMLNSLNKISITQIRRCK